MKLLLFSDESVEAFILELRSNLEREQDTFLSDKITITTANDMLNKLIADANSLEDLIELGQERGINQLLIMFIVTALSDWFTSYKKSKLKFRSPIIKVRNSLGDISLLDITSIGTF